jgi:eukaryotic-like serine/threonine-protein kinase
VQATWRGDGRELYYLGLDGALFAVRVERVADRVELSKPERLFRTGLPVISAVVEQYRPTADGRRFLFCLPLTSVQSAPLGVVLNWPARTVRHGEQPLVFWPGWPITNARVLALTSARRRRAAA